MLISSSQESAAKYIERALLLRVCQGKKILVVLVGSLFSWSCKMTTMDCFVCCKALKVHELDKGWPVVVCMMFTVDMPTGILFLETVTSEYLELVFERDI